MLTFMGQRLVPHLGYRQRQAKLFNHFKTQGKNLDSGLSLIFLTMTLECLAEKQRFLTK